MDTMNPRERLRGGDALLGIFTMFSEPALVEMAGHAGYDFVIVDTEHGPSSHETVQHCLRAADAAGIAVLVRVPRAAYGDIQRLLDSGASGIVMPHVTTAEEATDLVQACRLPPAGTRGTAYTARSGKYGYADPIDVRAAAAHVLVVAQIEDAAAVDNIDEIAAVPGVDCLFVGPTDLTASLQLGANATEALERIMLDQLRPAAVAHGRMWGSFVADATEARRLAAAGARLFALSGTSMVRDAFLAPVTAFHQLPSED